MVRDLPVWGGPGQVLANEQMVKNRLDDVRWQVCRFAWSIENSEADSSVLSDSSLVDLDAMYASKVEAMLQGMRGLSSTQ